MASPHAHAKETHEQFRQRFLGELMDLVSRTKTQALSAELRLSEIDRIFNSIPRRHAQHAFHVLKVAQRGHPCRLTATTGQYFRDNYSLEERKLGLGILAAQLRVGPPNIDGCDHGSGGPRTSGAAVAARAGKNATVNGGAPSIDQRRRWLTKKNETPSSHAVLVLALEQAAETLEGDERQQAIEAAFRAVPNDDAAWLRFRLRKNSADELKKIVGLSKYKGIGRKRGLKILEQKVSGEPEAVGSTSVGTPPSGSPTPRSTSVTAAARHTETPPPSLTMSDKDVIKGINFDALAQTRAELEEIPGGYLKIKQLWALRRGSDPTIIDYISDLVRDFDEAAYRTLMDRFVLDFAKVASAIGLRALSHQKKVLEAWRHYYQQPGSAAKLHNDPTLREARQYWRKSQENPPPAVLSALGIASLLSGMPFDAGKARMEAERLYETISPKYGPFLGPKSFSQFKEHLLDTKTVDNVRTRVTEEIDRRRTEVDRIAELLKSDDTWVYASDFDGHREHVMQLRQMKSQDLRSIIAAADAPKTWSEIADGVLTVVVIALSLLPAGWALRLAQVVAAAVAIAAEVDAHDRAVAAKTVGFAREYPSAIWIVLAVVGLGADVADVLKFLRRAPSKALVDGGARMISEALQSVPAKRAGQTVADPKLAKIRRSLVELAEAEELVREAKKAAKAAKPRLGIDPASLLSSVGIGFPVFPTRDQYLAYALAEIRRGTLDFKLFLTKLKSGPTARAYAKLSKDQRKQLRDGFAEAKRILGHAPGSVLRETTKVIHIADINSRLFKELPESLGGRQPRGYRLISDPTFPSVVRANGPGRKRLYLSRDYDPTKGELTLETAMVSRGAEIPMTPGGFELLPGRGTPAMTYYSVAQMKAMGIPHGTSKGAADALKLVKTEMIDNLESLAQLHRLRQRWPNASIHKLIEKTSTYRHVETTLGLAGYKITAVNREPGHTVTFGKLAEYWEKVAPRFLGESSESRRLYHDKILKEFGVTRNTPVEQFSATFNVSPGAPRGQTGRLRKRVAEFTEAAKRKWKSKLKTKPNLYDSPALDYERAVTGDDLNYLLGRGDDKIWADGLDLANNAAVEVKFVRNPATSAVILDSNARDSWRFGVITPQILDEMYRYAKVIEDPRSPIKKLFFYVNDARAIEYFEALMRHVGVPGEIRVVSVEALIKAGKLKQPP